MTHYAVVRRALFTLVLFVSACSHKTEDNETIGRAPGRAPEPWRGLIQQLLAREDQKIQEKAKTATTSDYAALRQQAAREDDAGNLNALHRIGTRFNIMACMEGRTEA